MPIGRRLLVVDMISKFSCLIRMGAWVMMRVRISVDEHMKIKISSGGRA